MKNQLLLFFALLFSFYSFAQIANQPTPLEVCDDAIQDGITQFDLTIKNLEILGNQNSNNFSVSYHSSQMDADTNINQLSSLYTNTSNPETVFVRVEELSTGGFDTTILNLFVNQAPNIFSPTPLVVNDDDNDGFADFDLTIKDAEITSGNETYTVSYFETSIDADTNTNQLLSTYTNIIANAQTVYFRVEETFNGCYTLGTLDLLTEYGAFQVNPATLSACNDSTTIIFDLTSANQYILDGLIQNDYTIAYYEVYDFALTQSNAIVIASAYNYSPNIPIVYAGVTETATGEYVITTINLNVNQLPIVDLGDDIAGCDGTSIVLNPNSNINQSNFIFQWSTGETTPEIVVTTAGTYTVTITNPTTGCTNSGSSTVLIGSIFAIGTPQDLFSCGANSVFDLTSTLPEIYNGTDPNTVIIGFYESQQDAFSNVNEIQNLTNYTSNSDSQTIFVSGIFNGNQVGCPSNTSFNLITENCPTSVVCGQPVTSSFCYSNNETLQYAYTSSDGSPLQLVIVSGQVENNFDELIVLDSDGTTNLNAASPYGNTGDVTNLTFASTGDTITIYVDSDGSIDCPGNNYSTIDYVVSCLDTTAIPNCNAVLTTPQDLAVDVNENVDFSWTPATVFVTGYFLTVVDATGEIVLDMVDVGNVTTFDVGTLNQDTQYFVTITPYNPNGNAINCNTTSFTTREIPNAPVGVACAANDAVYLFSENFETDVPSGWLGSDFSGSNGEWVVTAGDANSSGTGPFASYNGNTHLEYEASGNSSAIANIFSQDIDLTTANSGAELSFYMHAFGNDIGTLNINVSNMNTGITNTVFTWSGQYQETETEAWLPIGVNLDAYVGSIIVIDIIYGGAGTGFEGDMAIDYLRVETCGSFCLAPNDITIVNITETTADVSWIAGSNETDWEYTVEPAGTTTPTGPWIATNTSTINLTNLIGTTDYVVFVRSNCGVDGFSNWETSVFTTLDQVSFTVDCATNQPVNNSFCYENNETLQYTYVSNDSSPLYIVFNSGTTENNFDELIVLDSDGVTNLNADNPYGLNADGNLTGLTFTTTGETATVYIQSDGSVISCTNDAIDFDVFCGNNHGFIEVNAFLDTNNDGVFNGADTPFTNGFFTYEVNDDGSINTVNSNTGSFTIVNQVEANSYDITFATNAGYENCFTIATALLEDITVTDGSTVTIDFPITEQMPCEDLSVYLVPFSAPRPGFNYWNDLVIENLGSTTIASGTVTFIHDTIVDYVDATPQDSGLTVTQTTTGATVDFTNLLPGESRVVWFRLYTPPTVTLGEFVTSSVAYTTASNDVISENNVSVITQEVIGSYDPNDITESHGSDILYDSFITTDEYLYYTIRFQNVGTAEAINVRIENTLNPLLDISTLQFIRATHDVVMMQNANQLTWTFDNINLPAQSQDDFGSNGYVLYRIKPTTGYAIGTIIPNTAEIYFDFNAPVITNTFETEFVENSLSVDEFSSNDFTLYPNPATRILNIKLNSASSRNTFLEIIDVQGKIVMKNTVNKVLQLNVENLQTGLYFVKLKQNNKQTIKKLIIE